MHALPPLPYQYDALEPTIDEQTMRLHHTKHHQAYVDGLNKALEGYPDLQSWSLEELIRNLAGVPEAIRKLVRFHGGGHFNHSLFWEIMGSDGGEPQGDLRSALDTAFGSFTAFKEAFQAAGVGHFGSGWAWLTVDQMGQLRIESTPNHDNPLTEGRVPILVNDVWEHAYYLKYQNRRAEYLANWWAVVNWSAVAERYRQACSK